MMPADIPQPHDTMAGAQRLARRIERYWAARGQSVTVKVIDAGFHPATREGRFDLRSDMVNGQPTGDGRIRRAGEQRPDHVLPPRQSAIAAAPIPERDRGSPAARIATALGCSFTHARMLALMLERNIATHAALLKATGLTSRNVLSHTMTTLRGVIDPLGLVILTHRNIGYGLGPADKAALRRLAGMVGMEHRDVIGEGV